MGSEGSEHDSASFTELTVQISRAPSPATPQNYQIRPEQRQKNPPCGLERELLIQQQQMSHCVRRSAAVKSASSVTLTTFHQPGSERAQSFRLLLSPLLTVLLPETSPDPQAVRLREKNDGGDTCDSKSHPNYVEKHTCNNLIMSIFLFCFIFRHCKSNNNNREEVLT